MKQETEVQSANPFNWEGLGIGLGVVFVVAIISLVLFRITCVNFVDSYELGYKYDKRNGKLEKLMTLSKDSAGKPILVPRTGYIVTPPIMVKIHTVDLRPMQVCINANARVLNCKLVQFNPDGLELFLGWHGRDDYDGGSSVSNTSGTVGSTRFNQILMSYAFDGTGNTYSFLNIIRELKPEEVVKK
jgi:hypothetical protein